MFTKNVKGNKKSGRNKVWILSGRTFVLNRSQSFTMGTPVRMMHLPSEKLTCRGQVNLSEDNVMAKKSKVKSAAKKRPAAKKKKK